MIPLRDQLPTLRPARVVRVLVVLNLAVFALSLSDPVGAIERFGALAYLLTGRQPELWPGADSGWLVSAGRGEVWRVGTHMFVHAGLLHLLGNMWFLWVFGDNVEERLGAGRFAALYGVAGLAALASQVLAEPASAVPMVGASGAVAGALGAYLVLYPGVRVLTLVPLGFLPVLIHVRAAVFLWLWLAIQVFSAFGASGPGVAWWAHIGGFVVGMLLAHLLAPPAPARRPTPSRRSRF